MKWLSNIRKRKETQQKAIVFVDYEHWYYSYQKLYHLKPDPISFRKTLETNYEIEDIMIFADFSHKGIREEIRKLRDITNTIIETQHSFANTKKDMTDFIMLDYIYQFVTGHPEIDTYVLFTGDGHFQSVTKYLVQKLHKKVIIYGVKDAFSSQLKTAATEFVEVPAADKVLMGYYPFIIQNMAYVSEKSEIIPTFLGTVAAVSKRHDIPADLIHAALAEMLEKGLIYQRECRVEFNRNVKIVAADWEALEKAGLWSYE